MEIDKLLDHCKTLEKTISILFKNNASKETELIRLQKCVIEESHESLTNLLEREHKNQEQLDLLKNRKTDLDTEIKQFSETNEKLSHIVSIAQKSDDNDSHHGDCKSGEIYFTISETLEDFEQLKLEYNKVLDKLDQLDTDAKQSAINVKKLIDENQSLIVDIRQNDAVIRLLEQQNRYTEQQFDLVLNQLPWEPLTDEYISELRKSNDLNIRDLAESLQIQKNDLEDLNESLDYKKKKKLEVLEQLYEELNIFVQKRDEAILVTRFIEGA